jgi:hypothetical protein
MPIVTAVLIAEMLLLCATTDGGKLPAGSRPIVRIGLTGALLAELAIGGSLTIERDGRVRLIGAAPDDALLADICDAIGGHLAGKRLGRVISALSPRIGGSSERVVDRLVSESVLGRDRPSRLRPTRHPVIDLAARQQVVDEVRAAAAGGIPVRPEIAVVLALALPCRLARRVAPSRGTQRAAKRRMQRATADAPLAPDVAKSVDQIVSAVAEIAAAMASAG